LQHDIAFLDGTSDLDSKAKYTRLALPAIITSLENPIYHFKSLSLALLQVGRDELRY
jgi:hypothetical protein